MSKFLQNFINATGAVSVYNEEEEKKRQEENKSTLDKVLDTAGDVASGISNNAEYVANGISNNIDWATNAIEDAYKNYVPEAIRNANSQAYDRITSASWLPFGGAFKGTSLENISPLGLLFAGLTGANELEHNMEKTYAPTAAEYNYNFGKGAVSGASSVAGGIADIFGAEGTGNELNAISNLNKRNTEYSGADNILSLDYLTNPSGLTYDIGNMAGSMAALYPSSFLAPSAKVTSAAQTLKKLPFLRGLNNDALETMIRGSITSVPESLSEGGNVVRQAKEEGLDDPYLRGWKTAGLNLPALAISNGLEYGLLGGKIFKPSGKVGESVPERMVKGIYRSIPATVATSAQQGLEEYVQQGISNAQTDKDWGLLPWNASQDQIDALLVGALTGAPISGASSYARSVTNKRPEQEADTGNKDIDSYINEASVTYGIPTNIIQAQMQAESNFDQSAVSEAGAIGLMQLMPGTAAELGVDPNDPRQNVMGGVKYLKQMYDATGNWRDALIAYNEGLGAWQEGHRYAESVAYADKILNNLDGDIKAPTSSLVDDTTINFTNDILNSTFNDDGSMKGENEDAYNFFKDKTVKDSNGNFRFNATDENITALNKKYGEQIKNYSSNNNQSSTQSIKVNKTSSSPLSQNKITNNNNIQIETPNLDKLREFARMRVKTSRNPEEIANLQSLFKNNNEDSNFLDDQKAKQYLMNNYADEIVNNQQVQQQQNNNVNNNAQKVEPKSPSNNVPQNQILNPIQLANQTRIEARRNKLIKSGVEFAKNFTLPPQVYGSYKIPKRQEQIVNEEPSNNVEQNQNIDLEPYFNQYINTLDTSLKKSQATNTLKKILPNSEISRQERIEKSINDDSYNVQKDGSNYYLVKDDKKEKITKGEHDYFNFLKDKLNKNNKEEVQEQKKSSEKEASTEQIEKIPENFKDPTVEEVKKGDEYTKQLFKDLEAINDPDIKEELKNKLIKIRKKYKDLMEKVFTPEGKGLGIDDILAESAIARKQAIEEAVAKDKEKQSNDKVTKEKEVDVKETNVTEEKTKEENKPQEENVEKEEKTKEQKSNKKNPIIYKFNDKIGMYNGSLRGNVITLTSKDAKKSNYTEKDFDSVDSPELSQRLLFGSNRKFDVTLDEIDNSLKYAGNKYSALNKIAKEKEAEAVEQWINNATTKEEQDNRRDIWENNPRVGRYSAVESRTIDSIVRVIDNIYNYAKDNNLINKTDEVKDNGVLDEEQNRRGNITNGSKQSEGTGSNEEERKSSSTSTENNRGEGQSTRGLDTNVDERPDTNGRLSGVDQTQNGSGNAGLGNDERKIEPLTTETVKEISNEPALINYRMSDKDNVGEGGKEKRYKNNIKAIKLLKQLEIEGRKATSAEQKTLAKYSGWGGMTSVFSDEKTNNELKELLTDDEYRAAKESMLSAYYTAPNVVKSIWKIVDRLGFKGGKILEPSMGVGNFFGLMPEKIMGNSYLTGVELDKISGQIATQLYQKANINITGFEKLSSPDNFFDLAIGNVPFGQFRVHDAKFNKYKFDIHNYFFAKALDKVRPGGLIVFITTKGTMDNSHDSKRLRIYLKDKADLIGAIRLPDTAFKNNTGTNVISDIIILKKRIDPLKADINAKDWIETDLIDVDERMFQMNQYYIKNPEMVAGKFTSISGRYGNDALNVSGKDIDLPKKLSEITNKIAKDVYEPLLNPVKDSKQATMEYLAPNKLRDNSYTIGKSGKVYQNINGKLEEVPKAKQKLVKDFVNVKNKLKQLLSAQVDNKISDTAISKIRTELNTLYDTFVENNGYLNNKNNSRYLATDPEYGMVSAIERYSEDKKTKKVTVGKSDIFNMRTVGLVKKPTKADSPSDALAISLREQGKVDIDYMANLVGKEPKEIVENLKGVIYKNPMTGLYETQDEYLSGNVREKLAQAEEVAKTDSSYKENIEALKKVQPVDLVPEEITVNLGASWIPASDIKQFAAETVGVNSDYIDVIYLPANGEWAVKADTWVKNNVSFTETWGISNRWSFDKLLEAALNQKRPVIKKTISENKSVVDDDATTAANNMIDNIKKAFNDWIWSDEKRTKRLLDYYNTNFNNWKLREYDGSHLTLPGYSLIAPPLRKHQKDAVWRIMQNSNTLLAHSVGAGKTWTMQTAAMEMRRLGICKKPLFVIPGHMIQQFANEFRQIYPNVQLLIVSSENLPEVTKKDKDSSRKSEKIAQRQRILTQIATEDWDGIIISHDMFKRIPMSPEAYNEFYREQENSLEQAIREINSQGDKSLLDSMVTRNLEKSIINLKTKLKRDIAEEKKDMVIPFEELGIDQIFVDEADLFKNLSFTTKMQRVAGLSNTGSQRSMDMYLKTKYITKTNGGRGVVFATGTPISNTLAEMYTMMRYLDEDNLRKNNLLYFDNWANQFVDITQTVERNPDGNGYRAVNKASAFVNKPEMVKMFRKFADVKRPEDLHLKVPKMKTGKRIVVSVEASSALKDFITNDVKNRAEMIRQRKVDPTEDNMLKLTGELRKASLDVRLINPEVPASQAGTKISSLVDNVYKEYKDSNSTKGAQLIFCDLSTPAGVSDKNNDNVDVDTDNENDISNGKFNVYHEIKRQLIEKGIKENEIAFIHDAKTRAKKQELFDNVNNGKVRVLIGSTEKMGAGTNCQKKLVALHHLDCPWRPRDIEQREGRILRQGNENKEVGIYTYVTKDSFDANMWEKIKNKQHFISEALSADITQRIIEDNDVLAMSFAEAESLASGNPLMAEKVLIDAEVGKYTSLKNSFDKKQSRIKRELEKLPGKIENATKASEKATLDVKQHKDISGKNFSIKIGNRLFTDRKKAQLALDKITEPILKEQNKNNTKIGEIAGFDLKARFVPTSTTLYGHTTKTSGEVILTLVNNWSYEAKNSIRSIEATVNNMPQKIVETNNGIIKQSVERQKELTKEINKKFADEDKLNELLAKQADINSKLNIGVDNNVDNNYDEDMTDNVVESEDDNVVKEENAPKKDDADFLNEHIIVGSLTKEGIKTTKSTKEKSSPEQSINVDDFDFSNEKPVKYVDTIHINKDTKEKIDNIKDIYNYYFGYDSNLKTTTGNMRKIVLRIRNRLLMIPEVSNSSAQNLKQNVKKYIEPIIKSLAKDDVDNKGKYNGFINIFKNDKLAAKKNTSPYEINPDKTIDKFADIITSMIEKKKEIEAKKGNSSDSSSGSIENVDDDKFTLDTHTDTRNGELKYRAKVKEKMDFQQLKSLAKQSGGGYSRFAKGFLFSSAEDRQQFINAIRGLMPQKEIVPIKSFSIIPTDRVNVIEAYANNPGIMVFEDADIGGYAVIAVFKNDHTFFNGDHLNDNEYALYKAFKDKQIDKSTLLKNKSNDDVVTIDMSSNDAEYSLDDNMRKKIDNYTDIRETAQMLNDNEITDREREISKIGKILGTPVYWYKANPGFRGWHIDGITYLNKNAEWSHAKVFWHETFHWIAKNNPKLFSDMLNHIMEKSPITRKQLDDYSKEIYRGKTMPKNKLAEEMMADAFYDVVRRTKFLRNLGKENKSLAKRFIIAIRDLLERFVDYLHNPKGKLTTAQKKAMKDYFNKTALSVKDANGNNIFKKGSDGEIVVDEDRNFYSISKEEEKMLKEIYGDDYLENIFDDEDDNYSARFSADNKKSIDSGEGTFIGAFKNIKNRIIGEKKDNRIKVYEKSARDSKIDELGNIGGIEAIFSSPTRLAEKHVAFKPVFTYADNAMRKQLKNRSYYNKKLSEAYTYLEDEKKDMEELNDLMFKGDALSEEYGKDITDFEKRADKIVEETGVKKGTAKAYIAIRGLLDECYELINRARTQVQTKSETISKSKLEGLKENKFVTILDEVQSEKDKDDFLVTYEIRPSYIRQDVCNKDQLEALRNDEAIQILEEKEGVTEKDGSYHIYGDDYSTPKGEKINLDNNKLYTVKYREAIPKVNKLEGYVPHFFHDFYVVVQNDDGTTRTVDSGRNVKEAYQKAEQYLKDNPKDKLIIRPKRFDFKEVGIDEDYYAEMVGDGAYEKINERIADEFDMSIDDVKQLLNSKGKKENKVRRSSKHRFFGNIQHRTGVKGYEDKDLNWVLRHYFNSACRYEALETEFKPKAISYFERIFGRFNTDNKYLSGTARYIKDYINDVNGNPSSLEASINTWLNNRRLWRYLFTSRYGDRAALSVATRTTNLISIAKLGVWNVSSAVLNLTQLLNTTALLTDKNPVKTAGEISKAIKDIAALTEGQTETRILKLKPDERKAMEDTGVLHELGLDSGAGYSKTSFGKWGERSMILFKASERLARCATILAAYRKARNELNKNYDEAVSYARDINRKANFDYGVNDAPNVFRRGSIISQILFQFMKYPIKQYELMRDFIPLKGKKDATWQQKATFWGGWIFFAGAFGLPAEDLLWSIIGLISEPIFGVSPKQAVRQFLLEASKDASLPERVAIRTLLYGGLSNIGIDISTRVGMADVIPGFGEDYNKDANPVIKNLEKFGGATGGTIAQFYMNAAKGDNLGMLRSISPGMYNMYTAIIGESKDGRGRITTKYDDAMSRIIRGMGFKSTKEAVEGEALSLKYYNMDKTAKEKQAAIDDFLDAEESGEPLGEYYKRLKELGLTGSKLKKKLKDARENRKKDRMERGFEKDIPDYGKGAINLGQ